jgi:hypothetical protein
MLLHVWFRIEGSVEKPEYEGDSARDGPAGGGGEEGASARLLGGASRRNDGAEAIPVVIDRDLSPL